VKRKKEIQVPQKKAAFKYIKQSRKRYLRNQPVISEIKTLTKKFIASVEAKAVDNARKILQVLIKKIDKAKSMGVIHRKTASRKISRLTKKAHTLK